MPSVYDTLYKWARKTTTSFAELCFVSSRRDDLVLPGDGHIYRLKHWPDLPSSCRTAKVFRALSVMSQRPVNRHWILSNSKLPTDQVDWLLRRLVNEGAVDVIDAAKYAPERV
ncbi:MAG TPA: hypothetical protein VLI46_01165 [Ramlibacter sp.]|nr:hypothetical protein [Ramlibacter sp.]